MWRHVVATKVFLEQESEKMKKFKVGATAFSEAASYTPTTAAATIARAEGIGLANLQFLLDHMGDADIAEVGQMCRAAGVEPLTIAVMFHPTCPTVDVEPARAYVNETVRRARLLSGDDRCIITGPILRGLKHPRKGGRPLPEERRAQVQLLKLLTSDLAGEEDLRIGIEGVNRTESCSLTKIGDVLSVVDEAGAEKVFGALGDLFHAHMGELKPVGEVLTQYRERIVQVHLSEVTRGRFLGRAVTPSLVKMLAGPDWDGIPKTMESFTLETPDGFFDPLMVNDLEDIPVMDLYEQDFKVLQRIVK